MTTVETHEPQPYTFTVRLCDNEVDRDFERFTEEALEGLAALYVGKAGGFRMETPFGQRALRIHRTEIVHEPSKVTQAGEAYCWLKAWVTIPRTPENEELIHAIEDGRNREVSIGCSVAHSTCSICGAEAGTCQHVKGQTYNGKRCFMELTNPIDAFEWAFVAEPPRRTTMPEYIDRAELMADRVSNDPVRIAAMCAPSVDAVKVVRCVDCKHLYFKDMAAYCPYTVGPRRPNGFCEIGEKR